MSLGSTMLSVYGSLDAYLVARCAATVSCDMYTSTGTPVSSVYCLASSSNAPWISLFELKIVNPPAASVEPSSPPPPPHAAIANTIANVSITTNSFLTVLFFILFLLYIISLKSLHHSIMVQGILTEVFYHLTVCVVYSFFVFLKI